MIPEIGKIYNIRSYAECYSNKDLPLEAIGVYLGNSEEEYPGEEVETFLGNSKEKLTYNSNGKCTIYQFMIGLDTEHWLYESEILSEYNGK